MNRLSLVPLALMTFATHTPRPLPMAEPFVISQKPLSLFSLSDQRDSLVVREARRQSTPESPIPRWLALSISHAESWRGLDSTATNVYSGSIGLMQIHPTNWNLFPSCGTQHITNRKRNVCMGMSVLRVCMDEYDTLADVLSCYGGAKSLQGMKNYNLDVARRVRLEWLD